MTKRSDQHELGRRGYFAIGIEHTKTEVNVGTLLRSATVFGAAFVFTVGRRYRHQPGDTVKTPRHTPLFNFSTVDDLVEHLPDGCPLVGVELDARSVPLSRFYHPPAACYLLGAEDHGLTEAARSRAHHLVELPGNYCLNVSVAGSIVLYDRVTKAAELVSA